MLNQTLFLPSKYQSRPSPDYYDDALGDRADTLFQPEVYPAAEALLTATRRTRIVDVGCGRGSKLAAACADRKLGIDFGSNIAQCRNDFPAEAEWREFDLGHSIPAEFIELISPDDVIICSDVIEHIPDPRHLLAFLAGCFRRGALVITSTPDRALVRGKDHMGPPPNPAHVREWSCREYHSLLEANDLPPLYVGLTLNNDQDRQLRTIISIHEPLLQRSYRPALQRPLAIMSSFNEADVLSEVITHWIGQGCDLHILDNWSTDQSWSILTAAANRYGTHVTIERFPAAKPMAASWHDILIRKEDIAFCHKGRWIIHTDADEIRQSPFQPYNLADSFALVEAAGWNRVNFTVMNHRPVDDRPFGPGMLKTELPYFEFGTKPGHFIQKKAWLQGSVRVNLAESGGHIAEFTNASDCPYHFLLHHYPLRSVEHGQRKINHERNGRWSVNEVSKGWHSHYADLAGEDDLIWDAADLHDSRIAFWERHGLQILFNLRR
jgi:SAM-dependent methyltransferase